jgi:hypothetical protein
MVGQWAAGKGKPSENPASLLLFVDMNDPEVVIQLIDVRKAGDQSAGYLVAALRLESAEKLELLNRLIEMLLEVHLYPIGIGPVQLDKALVELAQDDRTGACQDAER